MEITAVGGYSEIGKNMTCIVSGDEAVILDMGIHVEKLMGHDYDITRMSRKELTKLEVLPDDRVIENVKKKVVGIVIGHAHLDHIGAVTKLAHNYNVPVLMTPFSAEVLREQVFEEKKYVLDREIVTVLPIGRVPLGKTTTVEFIPAAHSIPDATILAVHTLEGTVVYANDYKFDDTPVLGDKTDVRRLRALGEKGVKAMIFDTTRVDREGSTPSEQVAKQKIDGAFAGLEANGIITTTFASHIARLQTLINAGERMGRRVILLGRSMSKYVGCANKLELLETKKAKVHANPRDMETVLKRISGKKEKYMLIVTGNQGEPNSVLDRIANEVLPYDFHKGDAVMFCCEVIPSPTNIACRKNLEKKLLSKGASIYKGLHVSGHAAKEDIRRMINLISPENVIPTHGGIEKLKLAKALAEEEGFDKVHLLQDGESLEI